MPSLTQRSTYDFLNILAHELRGPLVATRHASWALKHRSEFKKEILLDDIDSHCERALLVLEKIIILRDLERGESISSEMREISCSELRHAILMAIHHRKKVDIRFDREPAKGKCTITGNINLLKIALRELFDSIIGNSWRKTSVRCHIDSDFTIFVDVHDELSSDYSMNVDEALTSNYSIFERILNMHNGRMIKGNSGLEIRFPAKIA